MPPVQATHLPNLERAAGLLGDMPALWSHPGVTHEQREALVQEVFSRITIDGKSLTAVEPRPAYAPLFAAIVTGQKCGSCAFEPTRTRTFNILLDELLIVEPEERFELRPRLHGDYRLVLDPYLVDQSSDQLVALLLRSSIPARRNIRQEPGQPAQMTRLNYIPIQIEKLEMHVLYRSS